MIPYIALQLKAISGSFTILLHYPRMVMPAQVAAAPFLEDKALYSAVALAAFTINAAYTNHDEKNTGSIEVGKLANLAVRDRNLFEIPATDISDTQVLLTLFEGKPVHGDPDKL